MALTTRERVGTFRYQFVIRHGLANAVVSNGNCGWGIEETFGCAYNGLKNAWNRDWGQDPNDHETVGTWYASGGDACEPIYWIGPANSAPTLSSDAISLESDESLAIGPFHVANQPSSDPPIEAVMDRLTDALKDLTPVNNLANPGGGTQTVDLDHPDLSLVDPEGLADKGVTELVVSKDHAFLVALNRIFKALEEMSEDVEIDTSGEIQTAVYDDGDSIRELASKPFSVSPGEIVRGFSVDVPVYSDPSTNKLGTAATLEDGLGLDPTDPLAEALAAQRAYDEDLARGVAVFNDTGSLTEMPSKERPEETQHPDIPTEYQEQFDGWWQGVISVVDDAESAYDPSTDQYLSYTEGGGTDDFATWLDSQTTPTMPSADDDVSNYSWWSTVKDGAKWLGDSTVSLLENWGPMGVAGTYAAVKGTDAVTSGKFPTWLLPVGLGVALLVLLR